MPISPVPKPVKTEKPKYRKPLKRTQLKRSTTRIKKSGTTKAKKVKRQKAYYASAVWKAKRKAALARAGYQCEYEGPCTETEHLQVHHKTNVRFGGDELPEDLIVYCKWHHDWVELRDFPHRQHSRT